MSFKWSCAFVTATSLLVGALHAQTSPALGHADKPADRSHEGDWALADSTDNNTGEREVYAFRMYFGKTDDDFVTLTLRCSNKKPTVFIQWDNLTLPDQVVLTIHPTAKANPDPAEDRYVFEKSEDAIDRGFRASPIISAKIISAIGDTKEVLVLAYPNAGPHGVHMDADGTQRAWSRVVRHCPVRIMPRPPL